MQTEAIKKKQEEKQKMHQQLLEYKRQKSMQVLQNVR